MKKKSAILEEVIRDGMVVIGGGALIYGLYRAWEPLAYIVGGLVMLMLVIVPKLQQRRGRGG